MTVTAKLWLHLVTHGGVWSAVGLFREGIGANKQQVMSALKQMSERGMVLRHVPTFYGQTLTYSVDHTCRLPDGLTLADVKEALHAENV